MNAKRNDSWTLVEPSGLQVTDVIVIVDREQGGPAELNTQGYTPYALLTITELLDLYVAEGRMTAPERAEIAIYLRENA